MPAAVCQAAVECIGARVEFVAAGCMLEREGERARANERESVCVCACAHARMHARTCLRERQRQRQRERERENPCACIDLNSKLKTQAMEARRHAQALERRGALHARHLMLRVLGTLLPPVP